MRTDPIADMLTRIRNANTAMHDEVRMPSSKQKVALAKVLESEGYISDCRPSEEDGQTAQKKLTIVLKYGQGRQSAIDGIRRGSPPGRRVYVRHDRIPKVYSGLGISILSTSHGLMSDREARKHKLGGELLCEVW